MKWELKVFSILHREGFTLNPAKSLRHVSKARYLGYVIEEGSISIPEDRKEAMIRALSTATGTEAMIALYDVQGCDRETARQTVADIADAIIDRYLGPA